MNFSCLEIKTIDFFSFVPSITEEGGTKKQIGVVLKRTQSNPMNYEWFSAIDSR